MPPPTYSSGSIMPWKKAGWYDGTHLLTVGEGEWVDDSVSGGGYSSLDTRFIFRWLGPSPSGDFTFKIPDNYIINEKSFEELDEKKSKTNKLIWKPATLSSVTQGVLDIQLKKQEKRRQHNAEVNAIYQRSHEISGQAQQLRSDRETLKRAKVAAVTAAYASAEAAGEDPDAAANAAAKAFEATAVGGRRRSRRRQRNQRRSRKRF